MKQDKKDKLIKMVITLKTGGYCEFYYTDEQLAKEQHIQYQTQGIINGQLILDIEYYPEATKKTLEILKSA